MKTIVKCKQSQNHFVILFGSSAHPLVPIQCQYPAASRLTDPKKVHAGSSSAIRRRRNEVPDFQYMQQTLAPCATADSGEKDPYQRSILTWLRENGRYLSPKGSGDLLAAATVLLRNWTVVQIVLAVFFLMLFLSAQLLRIQLDQWFYELGVIKPEQSEMVLTLLGSIKLWISPFLAFPLLLLLYGAGPLGWAYWMVGRQPPGTKLLERPSSGLIFIVVAACAALLLLPQETFYDP